MAPLQRFVSLSLLLLFVVSESNLFAQSLPRQKEPGVFKAVHVMGLPGVKHKAKGKVGVSNEALIFTRGSVKSMLPISSIQDVLTGQDSQRLVGGSLGTLTMFAPYESGRFLSLFRVKIDTLTVSYLDSNGGLHGAIFTLPQGQAAILKKEMVDQGTKTSVSAEDEASHFINAKLSKDKKQ